MLHENSGQTSKWPKKLPQLTAERQAISNDFMQYWHEVLPRRYKIVDEFNHRYVVKATPKNFLRTLEVGAGNGEHLKYEQLTQAQKAQYVAVDILESMLLKLRKQFPDIRTIVGDCQEHLDFDDGYFDRILAIHVLEHLPNLPAAVKELHRLCDKQRGVLLAVIPCEGSLAYSIARKISAQRIFEERYKQSYRWFIEREHINRPHEIFQELAPFFSISSVTYFPIPLKVKFCNLCIGLTLKPKPSVSC